MTVKGVAAPRLEDVHEKYLPNGWYLCETVNDGIGLSIYGRKICEESISGQTKWDDRQNLSEKAKLKIVAVVNDAVEKHRNRCKTDREEFERKIMEV